jgi:magnesium transporter
MNFKYMPELEQPYGYFAVIALMIAVSVFIFIWFRRRGWIAFK